MLNKYEDGGDEDDEEDVDVSWVYISVSMRGSNEMLADACFLQIVSNVWIKISSVVLYVELYLVSKFTLSMVYVRKLCSNAKYSSFSSAVARDFQISAEAFIYSLWWSSKRDSNSFPFVSVIALSIFLFSVRICCFLYFNCLNLNFETSK